MFALVERENSIPGADVQNRLTVIGSDGGELIVERVNRDVDLSGARAGQIELQQLNPHSRLRYYRGCYVDPISGHAHEPLAPAKHELAGEIQAALENSELMVVSGHLHPPIQRLPVDLGQFDDRSAGDGEHRWFRVLNRIE